MSFSGSLIEDSDVSMAGNSSGDDLRVKYGFWIVVMGLVFILLVLLIAVARWQDAADVTAVVGSVTGVVGTVVGAFFGVQVGSAGREKIENERTAAEQKALKLAAVIH